MLDDYIYSFFRKWVKRVHIIRPWTPIKTKLRLEKLFRQIIIQNRDLNVWTRHPLEKVVRHNGLNECRSRCEAHQNAETVRKPIYQLTQTRENEVAFRALGFEESFTFIYEQINRLSNLHVGPQVSCQNSKKV